MAFESLTDRFQLLFKKLRGQTRLSESNMDEMLKEIGVSPHFYRMLPYIITLVVLAFTSKKSRAPKAEGIPYDKGQR